MRSTSQAAVAAVLALSLTGVAGAQGAPAAAGPALTLDEAITLARRNNALYLQTTNRRRSAEAQVRSAQGQMLPNVSSSFSTAFQKGGTQYFNGAELSSSSDNLSSSYSVGVAYSINGATLLAPKAARANRDAVEAEIDDSGETLRQLVTNQYVSVLQAEARAAVQDTLVATAKAQLDLAKVKTSVGVGTVLDVRRAEVALGQAEVQALTARNAIEVQKLRLFEVVGVPADRFARLSTQFAVLEPRFSLDSLLALAQRSHPRIIAMRARERAADVQVKSRKSEYTPTLSLSTGMGGQSFEYTSPDFLIQRGQRSALEGTAQCADQNLIRTRVGLPAYDCNRFTFTDADAAAIRSANNRFPFNFERSPFGLSARLSLPIFDGFRREQSVQEAQVLREDARHETRGYELKLNANVTEAYLNLVTAARTVALQEQNAAKAREELAFAEERYRVGAGAFLDVTTSRSTSAQAQVDRVNSVYDYHKAFAALEIAVGRPLR